MSVQQVRNEGKYGEGKHHKKPELNNDVTQRGRFVQQLSNVTDKSATVLNDNEYRNYLMIQNNGSTPVYINFGNKADANNIRINAGNNYEFIVVPINSIALISDAGNENLCAIVEGSQV